MARWRFTDPAALLMLGAYWGCTYDFDAAFEQTPTDATTSQGGASASSSVGGSTASSGGADGERCDNGADDDGDGQIDCADSDCSDFVCAPLAPQGWFGPGHLFMADAMAAAPTCDAAFGDTRTAGSGTFTAPPADCSGCMCSTPTGGTCDLPNTVVRHDFDCTGAIQAIISPAQPNVCGPFTVGEPQTGARGAVVPVDTPGMCTASGGQPNGVAASFELQALLCGDANPGGGCGGEACVPAPSSPFDARLCIYQPGDLMCPMPYSDKTLVYENVADARMCSGCNCGNATNQDCTGNTQLYAGPNCIQAAVLVPNTGMGCSVFNTTVASNSYMYIPDAGPSGGSCAESGGQPSGAVTASDPITICCAP